MSTIADKNVIYGAWCLCHPEDGIYYVGQTCKGVNSRISVHFWNSRKPESTSYGSRFSRWIRKHGEENVAFSVLEICLRDELNSREILWISQLREQGQSKGNLLAGGNQARGHKVPQMSERMRGEKNPMFGKDRSELMKYARSFQGSPSDETRKLWSENNTGEGNPRAILNDQAIRELRKQERKYGLFSSWARKYNVTPQTIYLAYVGKTWKHVV